MEQLIFHFFEHELGMPQEKASALSIQYYEEYGLSVRGLLLFHQVQADYFEYVLLKRFIISRTQRKRNSKL
jgi:hypothetical protein